VKAPNNDYRFFGRRGQDSGRIEIDSGVSSQRGIRIYGPVVTFQLEAHDGVDLIARGIHRRRVIDVDRFARRVQRKRADSEKRPS